MVLLAIRDPTVYVSRMVVFFVSCIFFSIVYLKSRERTQAQVLQRMWLLLWCPACAFGVRGAFFGDVDVFIVFFFRFFGFCGPLVTEVLCPQSFGLPQDYFAALERWLIL